MTEIKGQEVRLKSRPNGNPVASDFELAPLSQTDGEVVVRNLWMSVDPYMRGRMIDRASYIPPFQIGAPLEGGAVGEVVTSKADGLKPGDKVVHMLGWREYAAGKAQAFTPLPDLPQIPIQAFLGVLGMPGLTAYAGLLHVGALKEKETVFVSAAAGAVGSLVCQIAKTKNCTVIGSAGGKDKCDYLTDQLGVDVAIDYKATKNLTQAVLDAAPDGVDVYFENVGGEHLQAALEAMRPHGRIVCCGMISQYNNTAPAPGPSNLIYIVGKSLRVEGFIVSNHLNLQPQFLKDVGAWITQGKIRWDEQVYNGLQEAPQAFMDLFAGKNTGKMLVQLAQS